MTLNSKSLAVILFVVLFGGIALSSALGWWQTESSKVAATYTEGEFAGQANPADIRGSYTFGDVEKNFGIPAALLAQAFNVQTDDPSTFATKELESIYAESVLEVGTASVRLFVAFYNGLPFDLGTDIYLPQSAADILHTRTLTPEQLAYLNAHIVPDPAAPFVNSAPITESTPAAESTERFVKGKTTFQEVLDWGVSQSVIEQILGAPMPNPLTTIKDFCTAQGLSFETVKTQLQVEVDKAK